VSQQRHGFQANERLEHSTRQWGDEGNQCPRRQDALTILVVDDDEDDMEMIVDSLSHNRDVKYVATALDSAEGVAALKSGELVADLIFLDINMPVMDGFEVQKILRKDPKLTDIPIVFLTTSARENDVMRALKGTAVRYIVKPDRFTELKAKTAEVISLVIRQKEESQNRFMYKTR
jgi:CheY-like chemotaxis protein